jgi:hypothetical protein
VKHPLDEQLRAKAPNQKLRSIPVRMIFNDPELNLRAEYTYSVTYSQSTDSLPKPPNQYVTHLNVQVGGM